jgi:hypothetical protein
MQCRNWPLEEARTEYISTLHTSESVYDLLAHMAGV